MKLPLDSDTALYVGTSVLVILVFAVALTVVVVVTPVEAGRGTILCFVIGFGVATATYYAAYVIYESVDLGERAARDSEE